MLSSLTKTLFHKRIVLASSSPRRKEIMETMGIRCETVSPAVDENIPLSNYKSVAEYVEKLALLKAEAAADNLGPQHDYDIIIAADTVVTLYGEIFGKPGNRTEAVETLRRLSGRSHEVLTGVCILAFHPAGKRECAIFHETTVVTMASLDEETITAYVDSGEPMDKAGAYGIQGLGCSLIERIEGDYFNVVGLPCFKLCMHIRELCDR
ncbi:Septum formation inhibitor Maf [Fasciolopsis buskii]|uniref:Septum formation inhibitor Maf n=1 Tax=Fasciolopsis buskii TaxID=27845 RepID=A0A8E0RRL3_9TREM|nr:Septum formation inhibitor Maf [Fasciolopsis buski]